jgi:hypothetical protein
MNIGNLKPVLLILLLVFIAPALEAQALGPRKGVAVH